jgi:hypothetical protein
MSAASVEAMIDAMRERGIIAADAPPPQGEAVDRPWFIALMQGVAGWLAGIFLIAFIGLLFKPEKTSSLLVIGSLLLSSAWLIYHADREGMFLDQLALAISIAGQVAVAWGLLKNVDSGQAAAFTLLALQLVVLVAMPNATARILATLFATIAWVYLLRFVWRPDANEEVFFEGGVGRHGLGSLFGGWFLTWAPLVALSIWLIRREPRWMASGIREFARPVLTGLLLGVAIGGVVGEPLLWLVVGVQGMGMDFGWAALFPLLSLGLSLLTTYGGFRLRSPGLLGFGIVVALLHMARFYYMYGSTLLLKSVIMLGVGIALLALGAWLKRSEPVEAGA